jgi:protein-arginine kinase activator protein McsA
MNNTTADRIVNCKRCGVTFQPVVRAKRTYCARCSRHDAEPTEQVAACSCGVAFIRTNSRQVWCEACRTARDTYVHLGSRIPCARCGETFVKSHPANKLCDACATARNSRGRPVPAKQQKPVPMEADVPPVVDMKCGQCGRHYNGRYGHGMFCTKSCGVLFGKQHWFADLWPIGFECDVKVRPEESEAA